MLGLFRLLLEWISFEGFLQYRAVCRGLEGATEGATSARYNPPTQQKKIPQEFSIHGRKNDCTNRTWALNFDCTFCEDEDMMCVNLK